MQYDDDELITDRGMEELLDVAAHQLTYFDPPQYAALTRMAVAVALVNMTREIRRLRDAVEKAAAE